ncbi:MAG TPA: tyrosinase family protein [Oculatellaceae cyanobacterium]
MRVRKNVVRLTQGERDEYVKAVRSLAESGKYKWYIDMHKEAMMHGNPPPEGPSAAHKGPAFLPWHRQFILRFERDLQDELANPRFGLPYWDSAGDQSLPDPRTASVWREDFMGGNGDKNNKNIVGSGPFRKGEWTTYDMNDKPGSLTRNFGAEAPSLPSPNDALFALRKRRVYDNSPWNMNSEPSYRNQLEGWVPNPPGLGLHNLTHVWVGGAMQTVPTAPNDPVFFLHHCNTDRLWAQWQATYPKASYVPTAGGPQGQNLHDPMWPWDGLREAEVVTPNDMLDYKKLCDYVYDTEITRSNGQLIQSNSGIIGPFDVVVTGWSGRLEHWYRDNDKDLPWSFDTVVAKRRYDTAVLLQTTIGHRTDFNVMARRGAVLEHWFRNPFTGTWEIAHTINPYGGGAFEGAPCFFQGNDGIPGSCHLFCPVGPGKVQHFTRDNHSGSPWTHSDTFADGWGVIAVSGLYSTWGTLHAVTVSGDGTLQHWMEDPDTLLWTKVATIEHTGSGVRGPIAFIQNSTNLDFEVIAATTWGLSHWSCGPDFKWRANGQILSGTEWMTANAIGLIESSIDNLLELTLSLKLENVSSVLFRFHPGTSGAWELADYFLAGTSKEEAEQPEIKAKLEELTSLFAGDDDPLLKLKRALALCCGVSSSTT